ncbi:YkyB family protein [Bacillus sp. NPDC094106]|uniref:YkyB family protein n=1 Tax=Bacillus sp. NPDC094106 TaxID=3363949 RepID=UPI00381A9893
MLQVYTYNSVPEGLYTKSKLKEIGLKPIGEPVALLMNSHYRSIKYDLYDKKDTVPIKKRIFSPIVIPDVTNENLCEALYIMNKSAKKSRDTKKRNYHNDTHGQVSRAKKRELELYEIKDEVIHKMNREYILRLEGYHIQEQEWSNEPTYLLLYTYKHYSFHVPTKQKPSCTYLGKIGVISAESNKKVTMKFGEADALLRLYIDTK